MKTLWFSFFVLSVATHHRAHRSSSNSHNNIIMIMINAKQLRGMFSAMDVYDQREHNAPLPVPPMENDHAPTFRSPLENHFSSPPPPPPQTSTTGRHPLIGTNGQGR